MDLLLADFARAGLGIACIINFTAPFMRGTELFKINLKPPLPPRNIGIVILKDVWLFSAAKKFLEMLQ